MTVVEGDVVAASRSLGSSRVLDCLKRLDGKGRAIVNRCGTVLASSADAALFDAGWDILLDTLQRVDGGARKPGETLARLLAVQGEAIELAIIEAGRDGQTVLIRAAAVDEEHVCLVLTDSGHMAPPRMGDLQQVFGLTAAEARIVMDLMEGQPPQAIARRRRNSIHTIRAHIRQCHQKIGARSREEMFSRIADLCL
jgi:DNA-binding CsgD family transcriptional regulator